MEALMALCEGAPTSLLLGLISPVFLASILFAGLRTAFFSKSCLSVPPGPKRLPVLGNALQMPTVRPWETYARWAKECKTDVLYLNVLSFPIVVLHSAKAVRELLEKRSLIYSDRPRFPFFDLMGWTWAVQFIGYGEKFRRHRRPLHTYLSAQNLPDYWPIQQREVRHLLKDLLASPKDFLAHSKHAAAGMAMSMLYGLPRGPARSEIIHLAEEATESLVAAGNFGDHFVDVLPIMKHIPEWVPGAGFQRQAREWRVLCERMINVPFDDIKRRIKAGNATPCLVTRLLELQAEGQDPDMTNYLIKSTAGVIYLGGADTTLSTIYTFFLAMTLYPSVQKRAQAEIDAVCGPGPGRLPTLQDKPAMPFLEGVMRELLRWNPTTPLGVPHAVSAEDVYEGFVIPKGSTVMTNLWAIFHDPETYPDPFTFSPARYLTPNGALDASVLDPRLLAFGAGRRICPGRVVGDAAVWTMVASILATFDIAPADGAPPPAVEYTTGLVSRPEPFTCKITVRSEAARAVVLAGPGDEA